jgi:hypothetical protein
MDGERIARAAYGRGEVTPQPRACCRERRKAHNVGCRRSSAHAERRARMTRSNWMRSVHNGTSACDRTFMVAMLAAPYSAVWRPSQQGCAAPRLGTTASPCVTGHRARWGAQSRRSGAKDGYSKARARAAPLSDVRAGARDRLRRRPQAPNGPQPEATIIVVLPASRTRGCENRRVNSGLSGHPVEFGYLTAPPERRGSTPSTTRPQSLQLGSLEPRDFERLCFRLTRLDAMVQQCRFYGVPGQAQEGIDLYAHQQDGSYKVIQCKRRSDGFTPGEVTNAVDRFLDGEWGHTASELVLAVTANLDGTQAADRIEAERPRLAERGIALSIWDENEISALLKDHPRLVDDFFGREAVRVFLGIEAAESLGDRLDAAEVIEYREGLGLLYREVFHCLERGIYADNRSASLHDRFVVPDVLVTVDTSTPIAPQSEDRADPVGEPQMPSRPPLRHVPDVVGLLRDPALSKSGPRASNVHHGDRITVADWLTTGKRHVIIGPPGSGKSALLRMLVLDVFSAAPSLVAGVEGLQGVLPIWLPFAFWTHAARESDTPISVLDAVRRWLEAYDHAHLWPLVEKALRDERLLIVVDGFDEWASPDLARACIDRLEVFASTKRAQVLASSRPFSVAEVPIDTNRWRIGTLASLDPDQQLEFITRWLAPIVPAQSLEKEADQWAREIAASQHLRELADLPLFLLLILQSREQHAEFPEDFHAVLNEVITRLIGDHRRRKVDTSGGADQLLSSADIRKVSAAAAEYMHFGSLLSIPDDELREVFRRALLEAIGYPDADAYRTAVALVNSLGPGIGLMVRPAPDETQFFHRSVLEFLAAERLLTRSPDDIGSIFRDHLTDARWSQVLRFLVRGLVRPPEIAAIFASLSDAAATDLLLGEATDILAADVAVGGGHTAGDTRRRLLDRMVKEIEEGERDAHRAAVLERFASGLSRREVRDRVAGHLGAWLRASPRTTWASVLRAASAWQADDLLLRLLWHGVLDENDDVQRVAGQVLGAKYVGQDNVAERLVGLASKTRLPNRRATAIEALSVGWSDHPALEALIEQGRQHYDFGVRHAAVGADLRRGNASDDNRALLIDLLDHRPSLSSWASGVLELMFEHYADDQVIFDHYIKDADPENGRFRFADVPATFLVLRGYTRRPEARRYLLKLIGPHRSEPFSRSPALLTERVPWEQVAKVYGTDAEVVVTVEALIREHLSSSIGDRDVYYCSLVARTDWVRDRLIHRIESREGFGIGWAIRALVEGWPDDETARGALASLLEPGQGQVPDGAISQIPEIVPNPKAAIDLLATLAVDCDNQGAVVDALNAIIERGVSPDDPRAKSIVDHALQHDVANFWTSAESSLYVGLPGDPRVKRLALSRLGDRDAPLPAITYGFRDDPQLREMIATGFRPLPAPLRGRLIEALAQAPSSDAAATTLLAGYDAEPDPVVKILAATAYARRLLATGADTAEAIDAFAEQARATGPDHMERRAAAFCALADLGALDRLADLRDHVTPDQPVQIQSSLLGDERVLYRYICRYWGDLKAALGDQFQHRFGYRDGGDTEFWRNVLMVAHDYPATRDDIAQKLEEDPALVDTAPGIAYLSRIEPGADRVVEAAIRLLTRAHAGSYHEIEPSWTALHVLGQQFADDSRVENWLNREIAEIDKSRNVRDGETYFRLPSLGTIAAIARYKPGHPFLAELVVYTGRREGQEWRSFHEWVELMAGSVATPEEFIQFAVSVARIVAINDMFPDYLHRPLTTRLRRDRQLAEGIAGSVPQLTGAATGIVVRLLVLSSRINGSLTDYLHLRLAGVGPGPGLVTVDALTGRACSAEMLFLDVLDTLGGP